MKISNINIYKDDIDLGYAEEIQEGINEVRTQARQQEAAQKKPAASQGGSLDLFNLEAEKQRQE